MSTVSEQIIDNFDGDFRHISECDDNTVVHVEEDGVIVETTIGELLDMELDEEDIIR